MNQLEDHPLGGDRGAGAREVQLHFLAIAALESSCDLPFKRQTATDAKRCLNSLHVLAATDADKSFIRRGPFLPAKLTCLRIEETQPGIKPAFPAVPSG